MNALISTAISPLVGYSIVEVNDKILIPAAFKGTELISKNILRENPEQVDEELETI